MYVDDIVITGLNTKLIHDLIIRLNLKFALKELGRLAHLVGIEAK